MANTYTAIRNMDENFNFVGAFVIKLSALQQRFGRTLSALRQVYRVPASLELFYLSAAICYYTESLDRPIEMMVSDPFAYIEDTGVEAVHQVMRLDNCVANAIGLNSEVSHYFMGRVMSFGRNQLRTSMQALAFLLFLANHANEYKAAQMLQCVYMNQVKGKGVREYVASNVNIDLSSVDAEMMEIATDLVLARLNKYN